MPKRANHDGVYQGANPLKSTVNVILCCRLLSSLSWPRFRCQVSPFHPQLLSIFEHVSCISAVDPVGRDLLGLPSDPITALALILSTCHPASSEASAFLAVAQNAQHGKVQVTIPIRAHSCSTCPWHTDRDVVA